MELYPRRGCFPSQLSLHFTLAMASCASCMAHTASRSCPIATSTTTRARLRVVQQGHRPIILGPWLHARVCPANTQVVFAHVDAGIAPACSCHYPTLLMHVHDRQLFGLHGLRRRAGALPLG